MSGSRTAGLSSILLTCAVLLATATGCSGSSGSSGAGSVVSASAKVSSGASSAGATSSAPGGSAAAGDSQLGVKVCSVITKVQSDVQTGSPSAAYGAQVTLGLASLLTDPTAIEDFQANGDSAAKATCPKQYDLFLSQAHLTTLASL